MEKIVLKVNIKATSGNYIFVAQNGKQIAVLFEDGNGKYYGRTNLGEYKHNMSLTSAIEYISDCIEREMSAYGIFVEFVNLWEISGQ